MDIGHQSPSTISTAQNIGSFCVVGPLSLFSLSPHCIDFLMHSKSTLSLSLLFPVPHFAYTRLASKFWLLISCQIVSVQRYSHLKAKKKSVSLCLSLSLPFDLVLWMTHITVWCRIISRNLLCPYSNWLQLLSFKSLLFTCAFSLSSLSGRVSAVASAVFKCLLRESLSSFFCNFSFLTFLIQKTCNQGSKNGI